MLFNYSISNWDPSKPQSLSGWVIDVGLLGNSFTVSGRSGLVHTSGMVHTSNLGHNGMLHMVHTIIYFYYIFV